MLEFIPFTAILVPFFVAGPFLFPLTIAFPGLCALLLIYLAKNMAPIDPYLYTIFANKPVDEPAMARKRLERGRVHRAFFVFEAKPTWLVIGEREAKWLLVDHKADLYSGWERRPSTFKYIFADSLLAQDGEVHKRTRRLLLPAFRPETIRSYLPRILRMTTSELEYWTTKSESDYVDLQFELREFILRIALTLLLGYPIPEDAHTVTPEMSTRYRDFIKGVIPWPVGEWRSIKASRRAREEILKDVEAIIENRMKSKELKSEEEVTDPLGMLMKSEDENGEKLTTRELANHALLLVMAGHETTASVMASFLVACIQNPSLLPRLRAEQDNQLPITPTTNFNEYFGISNMPLLAATFREVERKYSPVPTIVRRVKSESGLTYTPESANDEPAGKPIHIPKGSMIALDIIGTNHDPALYPNPEIFNPDRWLANSAPIMPTNTKLPTFGAGHRFCIGQHFARAEMMVLGSVLVRNYDWSDVKEGVRFERMGLTRMTWRDGVWAKFLRRDYKEGIKEVEAVVGEKEE